VSPDFREAAKWLTDHAGRDFLGGFGLHLPSRRGYLLVDASHRIYGMPFAQAMADCQGRRQWGPAFSAVVEVEADLVVPEQSDGVRTKIGRGALVSALTDAVKRKLIGIGKSESELRGEWEAYNRGVSAGDKQAPPRVQALKLAAWGAMRLWRAEQAGRAM